MSADTEDARPLPAPVEFHDFRDTGNPMEKRTRGNWNDWANRPDWNLDAYGRQAKAGR